MFKSSEKLGLFYRTVLIYISYFCERVKYRMTACNAESHKELFSLFLSLRFTPSMSSSVLRPSTSLCGGLKVRESKSAADILRGLISLQVKTETS